MTPEELREEKLRRHRVAVNKYAAKNREKLRAKSRGYSAKNKAKIAKRMADYYQRTIEERRATSLRYGQANREKNRKRIAKWCREHPDEKRVSRKESFARRRAAAAATGTDRQAYREYLSVLQSDKMIPCYWCGKRTRKGNRHADHIIPLAKGGRDDVHNLCCACPTCNLSKSDKSPEQFSGQFVLTF